MFAANSLSKAMEDIQTAYIADGHDNVTFADTQYKSSGELNEMLGAGSYADLLISASKGSMDTAVKEGYVDESTRVDMFVNDLVIVAKEDSDISEVTLQDIADGEYTFCIGDESVPAGNSACQALSTVGVYVPAGDEAGKTGKDISGKGRRVRRGPATPRSRHLGRQRLQACAIRRRRRRVRVHFRRVPLRRREDCRHGSRGHAQEHRTPRRHHG